DGDNVFGVQYDLETNTIRALHPHSNTFCSSGAFFPNGTLFNTGGAESSLKQPSPIQEGFNKIRTFAPGPCPAGGCTQDWVDTGATIDVARWYHSMQTLSDGSILMVGGSKAGGLVLNTPRVNEPSYEITPANGSHSAPARKLTRLPPHVTTTSYIKVHLLPNTPDHIFTIIGEQVFIYDYINNENVTALPFLPNPRTFPSSASSVLLHLKASNDFRPEILVCGGSSADAPNPKALDDCGRIHPLDEEPEWTFEQLPDGPRTMGDAILLPDGTVFITNGARKGSGGGFMADDPAFTPLIYNPDAPAGSRFTIMPASTIPRLYHSVAVLLPTGEIMVAGSNPAQQRLTSSYPTEYRVEIFSPPYMSASSRPVITESPQFIEYNTDFTIQVAGAVEGQTTVMLSHPGFSTHGVHHGQRMVQLASNTTVSGEITVSSPPDASIMPPGNYLLFATVAGIPSEAAWVRIDNGDL
ncbi:glyoxal oxidase N-terminus-domain-containing protein, partial [Blyttiomyces helicus]